MYIRQGCIEGGQTYLGRSVGLSCVDWGGRKESRTADGSQLRA